MPLTGSFAWKDPCIIRRAEAAESIEEASNNNLTAVIGLAPQWYCCIALLPSTEESEVVEKVLVIEV